MTGDRRWLVLAAAIAASGCEITHGTTEGESGRLGFYEPNDYPADTTSRYVGFERPLALGARADAWVTAPGVSTLESVSIDDPAIVELTRSPARIGLRGLAEGTTTLRVATSTASDTLPITVVRPDGARVWAYERPAVITFAIPDTAFAPGRVLRPGAQVTVAAEPLAGTTALLGYGLFEWRVEPPLLSDDRDGPVVNSRRMTALDAAGTAHVSTQLGGDLELATLASTDPIALRVWSIAAYPDPPVEIDRIAPADVALFALAGLDAAGRLAVPSAADDAAFSLAVLSGSARILEATLGGRYVQLRACAGTGTVRVAYMGATRDLAIEVTPDVADAECP